jgi:hypothetical protein
MIQNIFYKDFVSKNDQDTCNILHNDDFSTVNNFSDESNLNILFLEETGVQDYKDNGNIELAMKKNFSYNADSDDFSEMNFHENKNNMSGEGLYFKSNNNIENCNNLPVNNIENSQENKKELSILVLNSDKPTDNFTNLSNKSNNIIVSNKEDKILIPENLTKKNDIKKSDNNSTLLIGNKRKNSNNNKGKIHDNLATDNLLKSSKRLIINELFDFINNKIKEIYNNNIGNGLLKKELKKLSQDQIVNTRLSDNIEFLNKSLENIFSEKITGRVTNCLSSKNIEIIKELREEEDIEKKEYFNGLFNLTFFQCLKHFRGEEENTYIKGLKKFSELINKNKIKEKGEDYIKHLKYFLDNYEIILSNKKPRGPKTTNE